MKRAIFYQKKMGNRLTNMECSLSNTTSSSKGLNTPPETVTYTPRGMRFTFLLSIFLLLGTTSWSQYGYTSSPTDKQAENRNFRIPLIGEKAPSFTAKSTEGKIKFPEDYGRNWKILFSHPQDFTPVCSSEILELANLQSEFDKLGVKVVVVSVDEVDTHVQWKKSLEKLNFKNRSDINIRFPLVDDSDLSISKKYGMIHPSTNTSKSVRGVYIIDADNVIQSINFYPMTVGRSTDELLRLVTALQTSMAENVMTPANWRSGDDFLVAPLPQSHRENPALAPADYYSLEWYMWYKKDK
jgi:peroxiredoxin 2/4